MMDITASLLVLTMIALAIGAYFLWREGSRRFQAVLMLVLVAVIAMNLVFLTTPVSTGDTLVELGQ